MKFVSIPFIGKVTCFTIRKTLLSHGLTHRQKNHVKNRRKNSKIHEKFWIQHGGIFFHFHATFPMEIAMWNHLQFWTLKFEFFFKFSFGFSHGYIRKKSHMKVKNYIHATNIQINDLMQLLVVRMAAEKCKYI